MKILNKSQANQFLQCPFKWHKLYREGIRSLPSLAQARGTRIHHKIENYYKKPIEDEEIKNFIEFDKERIKNLPEDKKSDLYTKPLFQELKLENQEIGLKGTCDAVYINPKDDGVVIIDWKSGKFYGDHLDDYRFELAVYAELVKHSGKVDNVKYIAIYFVDQDKLFFEELKQKTIDKMYKTMDEVRAGIESNSYPPKKNTWCWNCQFRRECGVFRK